MAASQGEGQQTNGGQEDPVRGLPAGVVASPGAEREFRSAWFDDEEPEGGHLPFLPYFKGRPVVGSMAADVRAWYEADLPEGPWAFYGVCQVLHSVLQEALEPTYGSALLDGNPMLKRYLLSSADGSRFLCADGRMQAGIRESVSVDARFVWMLETENGKTFSLVNQADKVALDVAGQETDAGAAITVAESTGNGNQTWYFRSTTPAGAQNTTVQIPLGGPVTLPDTVVPYYPWGRGNPSRWSGRLQRRMPIKKEPTRPKGLRLISSEILFLAVHQFSSVH